MIETQHCKVGMNISGGKIISIKKDKHAVGNMFLQVGERRVSIAVSSAVID